MTEQKPFRLRLDMPRAMAEGYKACRDGLDMMACPYKRTDPLASEWHQGFTRAEGDVEKEKDRHYR